MPVPRAQVFLRVVLREVIEGCRQRINTTLKRYYSYHTSLESAYTVHRDGNCHYPLPPFQPMLCIKLATQRANKTRELALLNSVNDDVEVHIN